MQTPPSKINVPACFARSLSLHPSWQRMIEWLAVVEETQTQTNYFFLLSFLCTSMTWMRMNVGAVTPGLCESSPVANCVCLDLWWRAGTVKWVCQILLTASWIQKSLMKEVTAHRSGESFRHKNKTRIKRKWRGAKEGAAHLRLC